MSVFVVETYLVAPEKREKLRSLMQRLLQYKKENPKLFEEVRSLKLFAQMFGGIAGAYIEMWEFDSMAGLEKCWKREDKDEGFMKIHQDFLQLIDPTTFSMKIWKSIMYGKGFTKELAREYEEKLVRTGESLEVRWK